MKFNPASPGTIGAILIGLLSLGIFATRADLEGAKANIYTQFVTKVDYAEALHDIRDQLHELNQKIDQLMERH